MSINAGRTHADVTYQAILERVSKCGELVFSGHESKSLFDLPPVTFDSFPLVTLRKTAVKLALKEMEWFLSGNLRCPDELLHWWDGQLDRANDLVNGYSAQFRSFTYLDKNGDLSYFDQIAYTIDGLINHPNSRRHVMTTWNAGEMAAITEANNNPATPACCHGTVIQFFVRNGVLHMKMYQRSCDAVVGMQHNWIQYWALLMYMAHRANLQVGSFIWLAGDAHIYTHETHLQVVTDITNATVVGQSSNISLVYNPTVEHFLASDFTIEGEIPSPVTTVKPALLVRSSGK